MFDMTFWIEFITLLPFVQVRCVIRRELTSKVRDMKSINFTVCSGVVLLPLFPLLDNKVIHKGPTTTTACNWKFT